MTSWRLPDNDEVTVTFRLLPGDYSCTVTMYSSNQIKSNQTLLPYYIQNTRNLKIQEIQVIIEQSKNNNYIVTGYFNSHYCSHSAALGHYVLKKRSFACGTVILIRKTIMVCITVCFCLQMKIIFKKVDSL